MNYYKHFINHPNYNLHVNGVEYENRVGVKTMGGCYKNGYTVKEIKGKTDKYSYIQLNLYTSNQQKVAIEERWLIRNDNKVCKRIGWHNVDLLRFVQKGENEKNLQTLIDRRLD